MIIVLITQNFLVNIEISFVSTTTSTGIYYILNEQLN